MFRKLYWSLLHVKKDDRNDSIDDFHVPLERTRQYLLRYFETRDDTEVKSSELDSIQVRTTGSRYPWIIIKIEISEERNGTRLVVNFSFVRVYAILVIILAAAIAFLWILLQTLFESMVLSMIISTLALITWGYDINNAKRKFLNDISKVLTGLGKTD